MDPFDVFYVLLFVSPHLPQLPRRILKHLFSCKTPEMFLGPRNFTSIFRHEVEKIMT